MSGKSAEYHEWRVRKNKTIDWSFVRSALRYRQEVRDLKAAGFQECRSFTTLPFDDQLGRDRIVETRIADGGKSLWVKIERVA